MDGRDRRGGVRCTPVGVNEMVRERGERRGWSGRILGDLAEELLKLLSLGWVCVCVCVQIRERVSLFFVEPCTQPEERSSRER